MRPLAFAATVVLLVSHSSIYGNPCDAADRLLAQTHYADARQLYVAILKMDATQECAHSGLEKIAQVRAQAASHLELARIYAEIDKTAAKRETLAAAALGVVEASAAPAAVAAVDPFEGARRLAAAGLHEEALKKLPAATETVPATSFPPELRYLTGPRLLHFVKRHQEGVFAALVLSALLAVMVLRRTLYPRLSVADFSDPAGVIAGQGASLYLQQQLISLTRLRVSGVGFVTAPITQVPVPAAISSAIPNTLEWIKPVLSLLSAVYWRRTLSLAGCAHPAVNGQGVGMTLVLSQDKAIISTTTVWQNDFGAIIARKVEPSATPAAALLGALSDPSPYFEIAEPAAIWLLFQLLQLRNRDAHVIRRAMGTPDWRSYALNAAGVRAARINPRRGRDLLVRAMFIDPGNALARANLGAALLASAGQDRRQLYRALEQLEIARRDGQPAEGTVEPAFYTASYRAAHTRHLLYELKHDRKELQKSLNEIRNLARVMTETERGAALRPPAERERIRSFISGAFHPVDVMRIGIEAEMGEIKPFDADLQLAAHRQYPTGDAQYNLACTYSLLSNITTVTVEKIFFVNNALEHLGFALQLDPELYAAAESDSTLTTLRDQRRAGFIELVSAAKEFVLRAQPPSPTPPVVNTVPRSEAAPALPGSTQSLVTGLPAATV